MTPALFTSTSAPPKLLLDALGCDEHARAVGQVGLDRERAVAELVGQGGDAVEAACE
jgi:hypothetical protein